MSDRVLPLAEIKKRLSEIVDGIESGRFADEWDAERDADFATFERLKRDAVGPAVVEFERELRRQLGEQAGR